jgi:lipoprotein-anchoring transpeptidase ErfK/SrfK
MQQPKSARPLTQPPTVHSYPPAAPASQPRTKRASRISTRLLWISALLIVLGTCGLFGMVGLGLGLIYAQGILPGVTALGVDLGGMQESEAAAALESVWSVITVRDGERLWNVEPAALGLSLDAAATADEAYQQGRGEGQLLRALFGRAPVAPRILVNAETAAAGLRELAPQLELAPQNAGVRIENGSVVAAPARNGRALDIAATVMALGRGALSADGALDLVMYDVPPAITDAGPILAQAQALLTRNFTFDMFDPVTGDVIQWSLPPEYWASWLTSGDGQSLTLDAAQVRSYLETQSDTYFDSSRYLNFDQAVDDARAAVGQSSTQTYTRVYHHDTQHTVQPGETITSIAWDYGVPYLYIQEANGGIQGVNVGDVITIPSPDNFFDHPPVPNKRIVVSISQQHVWVYENGQQIQDWIASTGINNSPTWPGVYQILMHEENAYAGNWNLWMPYFMGVYRPIPGADFTNGFHGFPTRGGSQLLWTDSLGTRVTYGCILLHNDNVLWLYNWAENGVVVEIQP